MTARERKLAIAVGVCVMLAVVFGGYLFVFQPLEEASSQTTQLLLDIGSQQQALESIAKNQPRLANAVRRSLPADSDVAGREYEAIMSRLLNEAQVPAVSRTLKLKAVELKAPLLNPSETDTKKQMPAYTTIGLEVTLKRVKYATLLDVLYRYYQLNILQQISKFNVVRRDDTGARRSSAVNADIPDLDVMFTSTAIILNGAENRRSLLPVPQAAAATAGGLGFAGLQQSPETARGLIPFQFVPVMAAASRDYPALLAQDMFHGPPPPPPAPEREREPEPKEDTSAFIRLTSLGRNSDGTGSAVIEDIASRNEYAIEVTRSNGKLKPIARKFYYTAKGIKKLLDDPTDLLDISESSSSTDRKFRVVGLDEKGLVLASRDAAKSSDQSRKGPGRSSSSAKTSVAPAALAAGGAGAVVPTEQIFVWKIGEPLSKLRASSSTEGRQAVQRAIGESNDTIRTATVTDPDDQGR